VSFLSLNSNTPTVAGRHAREPSTSSDTSGRRAATGLASLDRLLGGGLPIWRATVVCGASGTGKTTLGLQFLAEGIRGGERGLLTLVDQKPKHLVEDARALGWDLERWMKEKSFRLLDASPLFASLRKSQNPPTARELTSDLTSQLKSFRVQRLVIDPVTSLVWDDGSPAQVREFLRTLIFALEDNLRITTLLLAPATNGAVGPTSIAEELASGIIELSVATGGQLPERALRVRKMRGMPIDPVAVPVRIAGGAGLIEA
jgi:circadian clock protein KaiC